MTPEEVAAVEESWRLLRPQVASVAERFYVRLFTTHPELREMFPPDLAVQETKFASELDTLVTAIPDFSSFHSRAVGLGQRHQAYGVLPRHYPWVREALIGALNESAANWDEALESAWRQAYDLVAEVMMSRTVGSGS